MKLSDYLTIYRIERDHDNETKLFLIDVPEAKQVGIGFQINLFGVLYGLSIHNKQKEYNGFR